MEINELIDHYVYLLDKEFVIKASEEIKIIFKKDNLFHLASLHKLVDIKEIFGHNNVKHKQVLYVLKNKQEKIKKSVYYSIFWDRMYYFNLILHTLINGDVEKVSGPNYSIIKADIYITILINTRDKYKLKKSECINLFLRKSNEGTHYVPISFFVSKIEDKKIYQTQRKLTRKEFKINYKKN